jgi:tetratricopeptide (TPR) repeat protein
MALRDHDPIGAAAAFRQSLALDDGFAMAHHYLGYVLSGRAPLDEVIRCYRRASELDPAFAFPHYNLGNVLVTKGDVPGAVAEYRKALELFPEHTFSHLALGRVLARQNRPQQAAKHFRRVIEINPRFGEAYPALGAALLAAGDVAGAVAMYRTYVQRFPALAQAHNGLLLALARQGAHAEAVRVYHTAVQRADRSWPAGAWHMLRYNAACSAVLAAAASGQDAPAPTDRPAFRALALELLRTELTSSQKIVESRPAARPDVQGRLKHWLGDPDLVSVRDAAAVDKLPQAERDAWKQLWDDVRRFQAAPAPPR